MGRVSCETPRESSVGTQGDRAGRAASLSLYVCLSGPPPVTQVFPEDLCMSALGEPRMGGSGEAACKAVRRDGK